MSKVLVIGMGVSGCAASRFLLQKGFEVWGVDRNPESVESDLKARMILHCENTVIDLSQFNEIIVSPGISPSHPLYQEAKQKKIPITGEAELAFRYADQPILGITGTNGKTTVTLLTTHVLNSVGISAKAVGNIGIPLTASIEAGKVLVAELSSYQLETMHSKVLDAAVILNITPDHLDRYASLEEYAKTKLRIRECVKPGGSLLIEKRAYQEFTSGADGLVTYGTSLDCDWIIREDAIYFKENIEFILPIEYRGKVSHEVENLAAAYALCRTFGVTGQEFTKALATFAKPPHRIEFVRELEGVFYFNDSKGTNIAAVIRAVESMKGPVVLIAGGKEKGLSYRALDKSFKGKVKTILAIGEAKKRICEDLGDSYRIHECDSLQEAVISASHLAKEGENVLLSPGCSSFDMFRDYIHRGEEFKRIVNGLTGRSL